MWCVVLYCAVTLLVLCIHRLIQTWRNTRSYSTEIRVPPGSMGLPFIGETIQFFIPSNSLDILPFFKKRIRRYGPVFRTSLVGRPIVVSADPEVNHFLLQKEGELVEMWYLDSFAKLFKQDGSTNATGFIHKYLRNSIVNHFGYESLKEKLLFKVERMTNDGLQAWSAKQSVELKHVTSAVIFDFISMELFSYERQKSSNNIFETFINFLDGLMSFPLNIPGTAFHKCAKNQEKTMKIIRAVIKERLASPETHHDDFLSRLIEGMENKAFVTEDFVVYITFGLLFASLESIPSTLTLAVKFLTDNPLALQELRYEHEAILRRRENFKSSITWQEYKSMTFTQQVINETLRMANVGPGILRRALKDINISGYTIPAGWSIMIVPSAIHMDPNTYSDPLMFNPWRWKDDHAGSKFSSKNFTPFGGGMRLCAGVDFSRMLMAVFLHVLITKYRWTEIKAGKIVRSPILGFGEGFHVKVSIRDI